MPLIQPTVVAETAARRYALALFAVAVCAGLQALMRPYLQFNAPLGLLLLPVVYSAIALGGGPAAFAGALGLLTGWYVFIEPAYSFAVVRPQDRVLMGVYSLISLSVALTGWQLHRTRARNTTLMASLRENERTLRALLESSTHAVIGLAPDGAITFASAAVQRVFGYTPEEARGMHIDALVPDGWPQPQAGGAPTLHEMHGMRRDGTRFPLEASVGVTDTPAGRLTVCHFGDIGARKQTETALLRERSELASIMDHSPVLVSIRDLAGRLMLANRSMLQALGRPAEDVIGKRPAEVLPADLGAAMERSDRAVLASRVPGQADLDIRHADGSVRTYRTVNFPISYLGTDEPFGVCSFSTDITAQKLAEQQILHAARHDPLTSLPNRALVYEMGAHMLGTAGRNGAQVAVLFFDLDRFKPVNDTYGHTTGDRMLQEVARRLQAEVRSSDLVGRLGGDEFVALLSAVHSDEDVLHAASHLLGSLSQPYEIDTLRLRTSPSIGIALYPRDGADIDTLLRNADSAMYHAKSRGRNNYQFFTPEIDATAAQAFELEQDLRHGVERREFELAYQPVIDTRTGAVVAAEALLRWRHDAELLLPGQFIGAAETSGLIMQIGEWALREAFRQHQQWRKLGLPPMRIAVNVSPVQFRDPAFPQRVRDAIAESGIDPSCVELEITESTVMQHVEQAARTLADLKTSGLRIALDDFGTGYSSLSYLSQLPIDKLKVDQSFIRQIDTDSRSLAIAETVIALGRKLGVEVVAEGVESDDALVLLRQRGCDLGQGYAISAPLRPDQFAFWYRGNDPRRLYH
jgi:diguanylate cyclase (GGDEF)-like protein/PAS domain S-box-containing protein